MDTFLACGGGFLVAVLWMDLMFDVLALVSRAKVLSEESLSQIATYYRRVTTTASPMNLLISAVMAGMVGVLVRKLAEGGEGRAVAAGSLALCGVPIALALWRVFPNAIRLGRRIDDHAGQSVLARSIAVDHLLCLAAMLGFLALRFVAAH
jgi:hypothetical protein